MTRDKKCLYALSVALPVLLLLFLFLPLPNSKIALACLTVPAAGLAIWFIRKRGIYAIYFRWVWLIMGAGALLWLAVHYLGGLHFGLYWSTHAFSAKNLFRYILPITLSIVAVELLRAILRAQHSKIADVSMYIVGVLSELLLLSPFTSISNPTAFMDMVGMTLIPSVTGNVLYQYVAKRYGALPNITYRLVLALYSYLIPFVPATDDAFVVLTLLVLPLLMIFFLRALYERKPLRHKDGRIWGYVGTAIAVMVMIAVIAVISCQFRFGALVIGTGSMTGELNVGDAAVYERFDGQLIEVGDVIIFQSGKARVVHRVVEIEHIGGELRYITKGDANEDPDAGYRVHEDIVGIVQFKIAYVGYPTLWIRDAFENN